MCDDNGIRLLFVTSPTFYGKDIDSGVRKFLRQQGIGAVRGRYLHLDFSRDTAFTGHKELFADPQHLNDAGARKFTSLLLDSLQKQKRICRDNP